MTVETMTYHPSVAALETKMSYGTLGILNTIMLHAEDNPSIKKNYLVVNGGTIVRNCYDPKWPNDMNMQAITNDFEQLRHYYEMYVADKSYMIIYFQPGISHLIPEEARKKETPNRLEVDRLTREIAKSESLQPNRITKLGESGSVTYLGLHVVGTFAYRQIAQILKSSPLPTAPKIWLISHCPIDYLLMDQFPNLEVILSHTGKVLSKMGIPAKVFKNDDIPFNRITYKLFGDKEFIRAACRNKPKAMIQLGDTKLRLKTEREIASLAKTRLGIEPKLYSWDM